MNPLIELQSRGQSIWLDFITRSLIKEGKLKQLIDNDGLRGVTSNPTIFQKAITGGKEYDAAIDALIRKGKSDEDVFDAIAIEDIQAACDVMKPVYDKTRGVDGYVSLEVNPHLATDTKTTLSEARRLFKTVARPNVMIKIPATKEGIPAVEQALGDGINVNITLIFALDRYQAVVDAWLAGLERADKAGKTLASIASVASFFVSRVDTLIDPILEKKGNKALQGLAAIANARKAYEMFQTTVAGKRFQALAGKGARVQRPLWASTSTKNPAYRDVLYIEELIGKDTVNTVPPATIDAFRDHGKVRDSLVGATPSPDQVLGDLVKAGIDMAAVTRQLEEEGVKSFGESFDTLMKAFELKRAALKTAAGK